MSTSRKTIIAGIASAVLFAATTLGTIWGGLAGGDDRIDSALAGPLAGPRIGSDERVSAPAGEHDEAPAALAPAAGPGTANLDHEAAFPLDGALDREEPIEDAEEDLIEGTLRRPHFDLDGVGEAAGEASLLRADLDIGSLLSSRGSSSASGLSDADLNQAAAALESLEAGEEILRAAFEDEDPRHRAAAALIAARLESEELTEPLVRLIFDDDDAEVRRAAAGALASMNLPIAADALLGLLESPDADPVARLSAWSGLARLGREEAWSAFEGILASAGGEVTREMVIEAALVNDDERLREPLERALDGPELAEPVRAKIRSRLDEAIDP